MLLGLRFPRWKCLFAACFGLVLATAGRVSSTCAAGFDSTDFSLRLPAALTRFSSYGDVTGVGGASAASYWASSINPASADWRDVPGRLNLIFSPQYSVIPFQEGTVLQVATEAFIWDADCWGTFLPSFAQARSNRATTREGLEFGYELDYYQIQWGKRVGEFCVVGANFNYSASRLSYDLGPFSVADGHSNTYIFRFGCLGQLTERLRAGIVLDYGFAPSTLTSYDFLGTGLGDVVVHDTTTQYVFRPGVAFEYAEESAVYFDYQFGSFFNDTGVLYVNRFYLGVDHQVSRPLFVRAGLLVDDRGNAACSVGLGVYPAEWITIDVGYQHDAFPELEREFRRGDVVTASLGLVF